MTPEDAHRYCQQRTAASHSSFTASFRFLKPRQRQAITAFYAYCREVDDVVDEIREPRVARLKLAWWRGEIDALYAGKPTHPVTQSLAVALQHYNLPRELLLEIIDGMAMDLDQTRYADFKTLHLYCYRVASVVGLIAAEIFGYQDRRTLKYAHDLGLAFQLTNIIRDVGEDAQRGRIYLPQDELARFHVTTDDLLAGCSNEAFRQLMEFQTQRAEHYYDQALAQLPAIDRKAQRAGLIMAAIYRALLGKIRRDGYPVLERRTRLPAWLKLWLVWRTVLHAR
ncbi:MAG: presqualene diphosphate synthase HpnD [Sterolibacterium sp.]|jgi:phytoene synthase|nr:presqualene diphosphate synthase HpnD [Sterolibacterium sp.]